MIIQGFIFSKKATWKSIKSGLQGGTSQVPKEERLAQKTCPINLVSILHGKLVETMCSQMALLSPPENVDSLVSRFFLKWILKFFGFSKFKRHNMWPD